MSMNPRLLRPTASGFTPRSISGLALWLDASSTDSLYTTDAGPVVPVASPLDIAGCVGWWDASDSATLFDAQSGGSAVTANGATVARWQDKSGGGRHLTQATANTGLPTLSTNALAGRNVVAFGGTGTGAGFTMTSPVSRATHTVIAVYYSETGGDATGSIINDGGDGYGLSLARGAVTFVEASSGNATVGSGRIQVQLSASGSAAVGPAISSWLHAGTPSLFQNGASIGSGTTSGSVTLSRVGYYGVGNTIFRLKGYIAELIVYPTALTTADRARVEAYLGAKWSIAGVHAPATASSDPVGYWGDKSGNGRHAVQATANLRGLVFTSSGKTRVDIPATLNSGFSGATPTTSSSGTVIQAARFAGNPNWLTLLRGDGSAFFDAASSGSGISPTLTAGTPSFFVQGAPVSSTRATLYTGLNEANAVFTATNIDFSTWSSGWRYYNFGSSFQFIGEVGEVLVYNRALTTAERQRAERYLALKWGITLAPQVANADAQDWVNRVYANGGTVSSATAQAVNQFCVDLENAPGGSIRDRFFRLNLFCGSFQGAFVPLFRGPSLGGTQYGGATDTNVGPFVPENYNETGASGGLNAGASNSSKYLRTGIAPSDMSAVCTNVHASVYSRAVMSSNSQAIGAVAFSFFPAYAGSLVFFRTNGNNSGFEAASTTTSGHILAVRTAATAADLYRNGSSQGATPANNGNTASETSKLLVFGTGGSENASVFFPGTLQMYSLGLGMTAPQAASFYSAVQAFQTSLTRNL